jgi:hypothetical protein
MSAAVLTKWSINPAQARFWPAPEMTARRQQGRFLG